MLWALALFAAALQARPFLSGFRLTADEIQFHYLSLKNTLAQNIQFLSENAAQQGRVGQFILLPVNMLASDLAAVPWARVGFLGAWGGLMLLTALWVGRQSRSRAFALLIFLVLVTYQRLGFDHMPPNSYPLQNTVPFLLILASRMAGGGQRSLVTQCMLGVVLCFSMAISEYAWVFGLGVVGCEYLANFSRGKEEGLAGLRSSRLVLDASAITTALVVYLGYRFVHPSHYASNSPDGVWNLGAMAWTSFFHILNGTVLLPIQRTHFTLAPWKALAAWGGMSVLTAGVAWGAFRYLERDRPWLMIAVVGLLFSLYVTLPVAMTVRHQTWCVEAWPCAYLDTRSAFPGLAVALIGICGWLLRFGRGMQVALAIALGLGAGTTYLYNLWFSQEIESVTKAWERADALACLPPSLLPADEALLKTVDPRGLISVHPNFPHADYWRVYIASRSATCAGAAH
ncbi:MULTISPECIES: hypothetical protein [unclassified Chelatococcus]|uniref:hypothetical protein n=1 Tax=unclassified Chelatococcus TaxID=2638111 RepID=UPI001BCF9E84|nr:MULTISPECIES: hypothetical protein [unclassified Chelatococcus]CAH1656452.1 conserved membrane hypothetical protein [Hyphomicrobiales bacterium]MBS7742452.1 hypothetical protein [Chelatococcus sp. HY11]MBX3542430.1 hypothetical protein [Chelatococcus sp.]MCO5075353.1 hypothetical protein [Chelatococcus sp.]CAH1695853.1 conserved membrane hypothetical protein [Hyphomicrobiales bacterium]